MIWTQIPHGDHEDLAATSEDGKRDYLIIPSHGTNKWAMLIPARDGYEDYSFAPSPAELKAEAEAIEAHDYAKAEVIELRRHRPVRCPHKESDE
jgi:hypothetical protein